MLWLRQWFTLERLRDSTLLCHVGRFKSVHLTLISGANCDFRLWIHHRSQLYFAFRNNVILALRFVHHSSISVCTKIEDNI